MSELAKRKYLAYNLGEISYEAGLIAQQRSHESVVQGGSAVILALEHSPVITLGKHNQNEFLLCSKEELAAQHIELQATDRGGQCTAHNPGQLVVYPIVPIGRLGVGVRAYVEALERAIIDALEPYEVNGRTYVDRPGVWVGAKKIAAIGVRIKNRTSMHGIAINVKNNLDIFRFIVPCGIKEFGVTKLECESSSEIVYERFKVNVVRAIGAELGLEPIVGPQNGPLPSHHELRIVGA